MFDFEMGAFPESLGTYTQRAIRFIRIADIGEWRVKVYGISCCAERPPTELLRHAERLASETLPRPAMSKNTNSSASPPAPSDERYGIAILIAHEAKDGNFVLISWWTGENMLRHHVYYNDHDYATEPDAPSTFQYLSPTGLVACVWELAVLAFERDAWIETILANTSGPDPVAYLSRGLNSDA